MIIQICQFLTMPVISIEYEYMKAIKYLFFGFLLVTGALSTVSASYTYPYVQSYPTYTNNSIYTVSPSYYYNEGCYSYFYNGTTRKVSIIGYLCSNTNYNSGYVNYTQPTTNTLYYYTVPTTYYTYPSYTYTYQNTNTYQPYYNSYNYNVGYTDTGYNNYNYYNSNNYNYSNQNSCYWQNGHQVCY